MTPVAERVDVGDLASPFDGSIGQRVEQDASQVAAIDLGSTAAAVVGLVEKHRTVLVEDGFTTFVRW